VILPTIQKNIEGKKNREGLMLRGFCRFLAYAFHNSFICP